ncbi:nucleotide sugar dehydrogenase [Methylocystis sp.]|uniref:nucleotide sugar dehydrogenase n=1 Tax=Methylocystis sp. TaxID=1911079 RepID=UPI003DA29E21
MTHSFDELGRPRLSVIGLGKLGAPLAAVFAANGFSVIGLDLNAEAVEAVNARRAPVAEPLLQAMIDRGRERLRATTSFDEAVADTDVTFIIVPTPSDASRLFSNAYVVDALTSVGGALRKKDSYHVVAVTSTLIPGSMDGEIRLALERSSGRKVGVDLGLCYNPEFIALGSVVRDMLHPDLILIGQSDDRAGSVIETVQRACVEGEPEFHRMSLVSAELAKIAINTFVTTKISYANMIGEMCDRLPGADAIAVTNAIGADSRIGHKYLRPAIGYGGPCFPRDNKALAALGGKLGVNCAIARATDEINDHQLNRLMAAIESCAAPGDVIAILGLSYKPDTGVIEESQGLALAARLLSAGYEVVASDPLALPAAQSMLQSRARLFDDPAAAVAEADVVVVTTPWPQFAKLFVPSSSRPARRLTVIDPWGIIKRPAAAGVPFHLVQLGAGAAALEKRSGLIAGSEAAPRAKSHPRAACVTRSPQC